MMVLKSKWYSFFIYFCNDFGVTPRFGRVVKRESGVNPEQTRCCKLRQSP